MTPAEADEFILRCRRILPQWQREIDAAWGCQSEAEAARDSVLETLRDIAGDFPDKASKIDGLVKRYRQKLDG